MADRHWHLALVTGRGSEPLAEVYPDWSAAVAGKRQVERQTGAVLTLRMCAGKCPASALV